MTPTTLSRITRMARVGHSDGAIAMVLGLRQGAVYEARRSLLIWRASDD